MGPMGIRDPVTGSITLTSYRKGSMTWGVPEYLPWGFGERCTKFSEEH